MPERRSDLVPYDDEEEPLPPEVEVSERSRAVAVILALPPLGPLGFPRFYVGRWRGGLLRLITLGGMGVLWLYDVILILAGEFRDADDRPLRRWGVSEAVIPPAGTTREVRQLAEQLDALRREVGEIAERVDFAERMLAQQKERMRLPPG